MRRLFLSITITAMLLVGACSRTPQPIVDSVKPAQQTLETAKGLEQTLQNSQENREKQSTKE